MFAFPLFPTAYWATHTPSQTALVWERGEATLFPSIPARLSWQELHQLVEQTIKHLSFPLTEQTVVFCGRHKLAGLLSYLAVIAGGGRILMLNPALPESERQRIVSQIGVDQLIDDHFFADFISKLSACGLVSGWQSTVVATLTLTSGSSGIPKAVAHTVEQHLVNAQGVCDLMNFSASNRWLLSLPLFHVSGQGIVWRWLLQGAELAINEEKSQFYAMLENCSHVSLVPTQLQRYLAQESSPSSQHILLGGSHIPLELVKRAQQRGLTLYSGYGMTEMASTICATSQIDGSVGKPLWGREVKIDKGQILVKGECLAAGYWQNCELIPFSMQEGWFETKDKGEWLADGMLSVLGRLDNMFISGGENIQPEMLEQQLFRSGLLKNIVVVPLTDHEFGHRPVAFVEFMTEFSRQAVDELETFAKQHLAPFQRPVAYYSLEEVEQCGIKIARKQVQKHLEILIGGQNNA